ncbi:MAG TPA: ribonuclease E/G, partial [Amycolatopsis sp.]|nr:ribonuclease E/G [Amycolatopsis sp.]
MAILEDDRLVELLVDRPDARRMVGDIYLGTVEAVLPGIQAAFVNIGAEKSAFLHASDLIEAEEDEEPSDHDDDDDNGNGGGDGGGGGGGRSSRRRLPNVADELKRGDAKLVQVIKEPIGTKGPRVTAQISLAGRFLVYMPFASKVGVSRKIENRDQRAKLRELVAKLVPKDSGGWIIRTVAEDLTEQSCKREIDHLYGLWKKIKRKSGSVRSPALLQRETSLTRGIIRDL